MTRARVSSDLVSGPVLARWLEVTDKTVRELVKTGVAVRAGRGQYKLEESVTRMRLRTPRSSRQDTQHAIDDLQPGNCTRRQAAGLSELSRSDLVRWPHVGHQPLIRSGRMASALAPRDPISQGRPRPRRFAAEIRVGARRGRLTDAQRRTAG